VTVSLIIGKEMCISLRESAVGSETVGFTCIIGKPPLAIGIIYGYDSVA